MTAEIKAMIFDVFGTVVDWRGGVTVACSQVFQRKQIDFDPFAFADLWRGEYQPAMERIRTGGRGYVSLDILHRENLDRVLEKTGLSAHLTASERDTLNHAWERLPPWPDSGASLKALRQRFLIAPCSNGSIALMARLAKFAGLPWDAIVGADIARDYKPQRQVYLASCAALGFDPHEVMMVAAHNDDLEAAAAAGLKTGFFPRPSEYGPGQTTDLSASGNWDICAQDMAGLAAVLGSD
ncbi:haloacid dehalogenase type II [uncultured Hoeflea sp.]|uniref:haloacid dehalogenase type II n=1 Tax=uncultured Hoeflea sp. TaxID=538666 RepID=UPI00262C5286|nr:haloacid dehalogenase type II [uncultured Hoeflea sp.]